MFKKEIVIFLSCGDGICVQEGDCLRLFSPVMVMGSMFSNESVCDFSLL